VITRRQDLRDYILQVTGLPLASLAKSGLIQKFQWSALNVVGEAEVKVMQKDAEVGFFLK